MVKLIVNGESAALTENSTLQDLVRELGLEGQRIAVEVNQEIVPRSQHASYRLAPNDCIEVVHAIGGG